jgi:hypothetical protein
MMRMRGLVVLSLIGAIAIGCATGSGSRSSDKLDYCSCEMWGVMGMDPGPDYVPPPRPRACERILKRPTDRNCPIPP